MSITDAVSLAIIAFFLGFALADRASRRQHRRDRDGLQVVVNDLRDIRTDLATDREQA